MVAHNVMLIGLHTSERKTTRKTAISIGGIMFDLDGICLAHVLSMPNEDGWLEYRVVTGIGDCEVYCSLEAAFEFVQELLERNGNTKRICWIQSEEHSNLWNAFALKDKSRRLKPVGERKPAF
jgi:hypothetical protein